MVAVTDPETPAPAAQSAAAQPETTTASETPQQPADDPAAG